MILQNLAAYDIINIKQQGRGMLLPREIRYGLCLPIIREVTVCQNQW